MGNSPSTIYTVFASTRLINHDYNSNLLKSNQTIDRVITNNSSASRLCGNSHSTASDAYHCYLIDSVTSDICELYLCSSEYTRHVGMLCV